MYESHFGLRDRPFRPTPDAGAYYPATGHELALDRLRVALAEDQGLALLTGAPGTGKTLLCHVLLERLGDVYNPALLTNSHVGNVAGMLQAILHDLSLPHEGRGEQELRLALTDALLASYAQGRPTLLMFDEAQNLPPDALEELRLLGNLEGREGKAIQVILVAQPLFLETLDQPTLAALRQRLSIRAQLCALTQDEAADYLVHQIKASGGKPERVFSDEALSLLARGSEGIPRLLNQTAHQSLSIACRAEMEQVDAEVALEALSFCGIEVDLEDGEDSLSTKQASHTFDPHTNGRSKHGAEDGQNA
jgi:MSHA biogenesis protein MshM